MQEPSQMKRRERAAIRQAIRDSGDLLTPKLGSAQRRALVRHQFPERLSDCEDPYDIIGYDVAQHG